MTSSQDTTQRADCFAKIRLAITNSLVHPERNEQKTVSFYKNLSTSSGVVAVVAFQASGGHQVSGMAVVAGSPLMTNTGLTLAGIGVSSIELGRSPSGSIVALIAGHIPK